MKNLTKADRERGKKLQDLGCIVCLEFNDCHTPCGIHHLEGQTKPGCHKLTIGLCSGHHQVPSNSKPPEWICRHHDGRAAFEEAYHSEVFLLQKTNELIGED